MKLKKLLDTGLYAIVSVEEEVFYSVKKGEYLNKQYQNLKYQNELDLRGLLIITPSPPLNPNYSEFQNEVIRYNQMEPFNIPYHSKVVIQVPIYGGLAYDAVSVVARAFHNVIEKGGNVTDGPQVIRALKEISYKSEFGIFLIIDLIDSINLIGILGYHVHIDDHGKIHSAQLFLSKILVVVLKGMQIVVTHYWLLKL